MTEPKAGERVWYILPGGGFVPAIIVRNRGLEAADLVVFAMPFDGAEFQHGSCPKPNVPM